LINVLRGIGLRMAENGGSYIFNTLAVSFVVTTVGVEGWIGPLAVAVGSLVGMVSVPWAGALSDRFGRIPVYRFGAGVLLVLAFPGWWLLSLGNPLVIILVITVAIGFGVNTMLGSQCALLPELFGNRHRYIGVATTREFSAVLAGGIAPVAGAWLISISGGAWWPVATYVFVLSAITFATTFLVPESRGRDLTLIEDASRDSAEQVGQRPTPTTSPRSNRGHGRLA
jgi:MHS family metabolite:H+ symporter-like MFS transporter